MNEFSDDCLRTGHRWHRVPPGETADVLATGRDIGRRAFLVTSLSVVASGLTFAPSPARAQWPERPVKILVPFAAGGNTDVIARIAAEALSVSLGHQFVVENRPGASGILAMEQLSRADADGYTLMVAAAPQLVIVPALRTVKFDPTKDFTAIKNLATNPFVLLLHRSVPATTLTELAAYGRANPKKLSYGSAGPGSISHLAAAMLFERAQIEATHVAYRGNAPALNDLMGGHLSLMFANLSEALAQTSNAELRILGVTSARRAPQLPSTPTVAESGFEGYEAITWNGLIGPVGLPTQIVRQIEGALTKHMADPVIAQRLTELGVNADTGSSIDFAERIKRELPIWAVVVKAAGVQQ
jgi:tripartite-type tricarboxylate transporter receptor subunit TctC